MTLPSFFLLATLIYNCSASETILVTATRLTGKGPAISGSSQSFNKATLTKKSNPTDTLNAEAGLQVRSQGGPGQSKSLFIRGSNAEHTLVLIDGIPVNDSISPNRTFDFAFLDSSSFERVEVVKGPQSGLYGSDAMGGVVQLFSLRPALGPAVGNVEGEYGSYNSGKIHATAGKRWSDGALSFSAHHMVSEGFSAANEIYGNTEKDGYRKDGAALRLEKDLSATTSIDAVAHFFDSLTEQDVISGDSKAQGKSRSYLARVQGKSLFFGEHLESIFGLSLHKQNRNYRNTNPDSFYRSQLYKLDWLNHYHLKENATLSVGIDSQEEKGSSSDIREGKSERSLGAFTQYAFEGEVLFAALVARYDHFKRFGNKATYKIAPGAKINSGLTIIKATLATGFKAPSLYQTYSSYGALTLKPETNLAWDLEVEQKLWDPTWQVALSYFEQRYRNLITSSGVAPYTYQNNTSVLITGWESGLKRTLANSWSIATNFSRLDTRDKITGLKLLRRAESQAKLFLSSSPLDPIQFYGGLTQIGRREDLDPSSGLRKTMPSYSLLDLGGSWTLNHTWTAKVRIENALNKRYEDIAGYGTAGRSIYAGLEAKL